MKSRGSYKTFWVSVHPTRGRKADAGELWERMRTALSTCSNSSGPAWFPDLNKNSTPTLTGMSLSTISVHGETREPEVQDSGYEHWGRRCVGDSTSFMGWVYSAYRAYRVHYRILGFIGFGVV